MIHINYHNPPVTAVTMEPESPYFVHNEGPVEFSCVYRGQYDPTEVQWFKVGLLHLLRQISLPKVIYKVPQFEIGPPSSS